MSISLNVPISPNVPMSPNFSKNYNLNYVVDVMNDVIFMLGFPKFTLSNFYMNSFERVLQGAKIYFK